ncbi:N-6 DNA methylase [Geobacter sp. AOG1]|uniref:class I SAM-dependent DNA methyltransferase n=1 Tax=Geobacter sp. AOG1 TaxID=1566346 RepID=UPI001CC38677|nr:N-6 DNA methylase [Geobacter sp. AOG1]GFE56734.1 DNA methyltransferase [Geobacter sp. AOG1]
MARGRKKSENGNGNGKSLATQQSVNSAVKSICDIMRRSNCAGAMQYVPELTWILFLRILDDHETREAEEMEALGLEFNPSLAAPYRWHDWAAPFDAVVTVHREAGHKQGWKRKETHADGSSGDFFRFINSELLPHLRGLKDKSGATPRQKVISEIMSDVERVRIDTERNFCEVLDKVHDISVDSVDDTHVFTISQVYEGLLLKMGEKGGDGGQFFTPREVIRAMVRAVDPKVGETVYDPGCGTGGFLAQSHEYMRAELGADAQAEQIDTLKHKTFFGREKENLIYPIALANLVLHGIDQPNLWHGNTLTNEKTYDGLFVTAPAQFDVILTNPPFGGKEGKAAQTNFAYKTGATQVLFLQHVIDNLKDGGRCGIVLDEGVLFRTNETAFVQTKRKLLEENNLYCIVSLPGGVFTAAGAGVKTNLLFFKKGEHTENIWYYDLSGIKVGKKSPLTLDKFEEFFRLLPTRGDSEQSWTVDMTARKQKAREEAEPYKQQASKKEREAAQWSDRAKELKKAKPVDDKAVAGALQKAAELSKEAREQAAKAEEIGNAVYDLKAVNPNAKAEEDKRTPLELLDFIEAKGREIAEALAALRG